MGLTRAELEVQRVAFDVTQDVDFRAPTPTRAAQSVICGFVGI
jgi:hypothetical protein